MALAVLMASPAVRRMWLLKVSRRSSTTPRYLISSRIRTSAPPSHSHRGEKNHFLVSTGVSVLWTAKERTFVAIQAKISSSAGLSACSSSSPVLAEPTIVMSSAKAMRRPARGYRDCKQWVVENVPQRRAEHRSLRNPSGDRSGRSARHHHHAITHVSAKYCP